MTYWDVSMKEVLITKKPLLYASKFINLRQLIQKSTRKDEILRDMVRILGKSKDGNLISEHLEFILTQNLEIGQEIFDLTPLSVMLPGNFSKYRSNDL